MNYKSVVRICSYAVACVSYNVCRLVILF